MKAAHCFWNQRPVFSTLRVAELVYPEKGIECFQTPDTLSILEKGTLMKNL